MDVRLGSVAWPVTVEAWGKRGVCNVRLDSCQRHRGQGEPHIWKQMEDGRIRQKIEREPLSRIHGRFTGS